MKVLLLIMATMIWGMGFVGTRWTFVDYSPLWSNGLRFLFAGAISLPFMLIKPQIFKNKGVILSSLVLMGGMQFQTFGLELTTLAKSGFITALYSVITPIMVIVIKKTKFNKAYWALLASSMFGVALLCNLELEQFNFGDFLTLCCAFFFSAHILCVDKYGETANPFMFNFGQCFYTGVFSVALAFAFEGLPRFEPLLDINNLFVPSALTGFIVLAIFSSLIAFSLQVYAQRDIAPHVVSLVFLTEAIFASLFGYIFFTETLSFTALLGCALVLVSVALIPYLTNFNK